MSIALALPDERLIGLVETYGLFAMELEESTIAPGLIAFNLSGTPIHVNGERRREQALLGLPADPVYVDYRIGPGSVMTMRLSPGTLNRLLHVDVALERGVVGLDEERHGKVARLDCALRAIPAEPLAQFAMLDRLLVEMLAHLKPSGLAERYLALCRERAGDLAVSEAVDALGCTARTLQRACISRFGRTPKRIARGLRLGTIGTAAQSSDERIELRADFPFSDLSHFLKEMRQITGFSRTGQAMQAEKEATLPYRFFWSDGSEAKDDSDRNRWLAERERRWNFVRS